MNAETKSIAQVAAELSEDPTAEQSIAREIEQSTLVTRLLHMRVASGVTQEQLAKRMECAGSKISRMESGNDTQLKWGDVVNYVRALGLDMCVCFEDPRLPAAEKIKQCVFDISNHLEDLTALAAQVGGGDEIAKKIHQFSGEVLLNFLIRYQDHSAKLGSVLRVAPSLGANEPRASHGSSHIVNQTTDLAVSAS